MAQMRQRVGSLIPKFSGLQVAIAGAFASLTAGLVARSFIQAADAAEGYRVRLSVLLGSQREANELFKDMADFASGVSFQYEEIMDSATSLAGVLEDGREEVSKWMPVLADLAAASGLTMQETTSNFIRMYSSGAAAADMFRDRGILSMLGFQAKTQYTAEQTRKMLMEAWEAPTSKFRDAALKLANTWSGLMSMMADRWFQLRVYIMEEGGVLDYMKAVAKTLLGFIENLKKEGKLDEWAITQAQRIIKAFELIAIGAGYAMDAFRGWRMIWQGLVMLANLLAKAAGWVYEQWLKFGHWLDELYIKVMKIRLTMLEFFSKLTDEVKDEIKATKELIKTREKMMSTQGAELAKAKAIQLQAEARLLTAMATLEQIAKEVPYNERIKKQLEELRRLAEEYRREREGTDDEGAAIRPPKPVKVDTKLIAAQLDAETKMALESNKTMMAAIEGQWAEHNIKLKAYFQERINLINEAHDIQMAAIDAELAREQDPAKRVALQAQRHALEEQYMRTILQLQLDLNAATKDEADLRKEAADVIQQIDNRLAQSRATGGGLAAQFALEQEQLRQQQEADIQRLLDLKAKGMDVEKEMQAAHHKHMLEQEQLAANQRKQLWQTYVDSIHTTLSGMTSMFNDWYQAAGSKHKELFNLYKAASIAETIIATYSAAQKAYDAMAKVPYVGPQLAATAAAVAIAAGLARVQLIRQQQMAAGGEVGVKDQIMGLPVFTSRAPKKPHGKITGVSPHAKADNVLVHATAGEYMQPVDVVRYYGLRAMEVIRRKLIPREVLEYYTLSRQQRRLVDHIPPRSPAVMTVDAIKRAAGGLIPGISPTPTADNITINATAGEYMQPVSTVKHYGLRAMEAIRQKIVPRELLLRFVAQVPNIRVPAEPRYQTGGAVAAAAASRGGDTNLNMPVAVNLPEQLSFIGRRLEAEIEPVILRVLQEELRY
jgi:hypothetical protein